jgi:hypothetical protein
MTGRLSDIKKNSFFVIWLSLAVLMNAGSLHAQDKQQLPDSVVADSVVTKEQTVTVVDSVKDSKVDSASTSSTSSEEPVADSVIFRTIPGPEVGKYKSDPDYAYANDPRYWKEEKDNRDDSAFWKFLERVFSSVFFRWFIYCSLVGILLFAIYKIVSGNRMHLFYKTRAGNQPATGENGTDIYDEDLDAKITEAVGQHDFRMGVRYLFLKALRLLSDEELIRFHVQSTNREYAEQLSGHPLEKDFGFLAYAYEHVWYGDRPLSEPQFERVMGRFQDFYRSIIHS